MSVGARVWGWVAAAALGVMAATPAWGQAAGDQVGGGVESQPVLPGDARWAGVMVIVALGLFLAAGCIGPIARMHRGEGEWVK